MTHTADPTAMCRRGLASLGLLALPAIAWAQGFPSGPLRLYVGSGAGGGADSIARYYAEKLRVLSGQAVVVENRTGAGGNLATAAVARAPADGHHILFSTTNTLTGNFQLYRDLPFRVTDFAPLATLGQSGFVVIVNPAQVPANSVLELAGFIRAKGGQATFASPTSFALATSQLFLALAGLEAEQVSYRSAAAAMNDVLGGRIDFFFVDAPLAMAQARSGGVRMLAVTSAERIAAAPEVPTMQEAGIAGYEMTAWFAAFVPAATPPGVRDRLESWLTTIAASDETREFLLRIGADPLPGNAAALARLVAAYGERWRAIAARTRLEPM